MNQKKQKMFFMENRLFDLKLNYKDASSESIVTNLNISLSKYNTSSFTKFSLKKPQEPTKAKLNFCISLPENFKLLADLNLKQNNEAKLTLLKTFNGTQVKSSFICDYKNAEKNNINGSVKKQISKWTKITASFSKFLNNSRKDFLKLDFKNSISFESLVDKLFLDLKFENKIEAQEINLDLKFGIKSTAFQKINYDFHAKFNNRLFLKPTFLFWFETNPFEWGWVKAETEANLSTQKNSLKISTQFKLNEILFLNIRLKNFKHIENCWAFQFNENIKVFQNVSLDFERMSDRKSYIDFGVGVVVNV